MTNVKELKLQKKQINEERVHKELCIHFNVDDIYFYSGFKLLKIYTNDLGSISISDHKMSISNFEKLFKTITGYKKEIWETYLRWVTKEKFIARNITVSFDYCIFEEDGTPREDISKFTKQGNIDKPVINRMYKQWQKKGLYSLDRFSGLLRCYAPAKPLIINRNEKMKELLQIILGDNYEIFMNYIALLVCENRREMARPTLVLTGVRGTGKNFIVETFIKNIMNDVVVTSLPPNYQIFTGYAKKKFVYLDETEVDIDRNALGVMVKKFSGSKTVSINQKREKVYDIENRMFFAVMSNARPFNIKEMPDSDADNQFFVINLKLPLNRNEEFVAFREENGSELSNFIKESAGFFVKDELIPRYIKIKKRYTNSYRYGFPIPVTRQLKNWNSMSALSYEFEIDNIIHELYSMKVYDISCKFQRSEQNKIEDLVYFFRENNFLSTYLLKNYARVERSNISIKKISSYVAEQPYVLGNRTTSVNNMSIRGFDVDRDVFKTFMKIDEKNKKEAEKEDRKKKKEISKMDSMDMDL